MTDARRRKYALGCSTSAASVSGTFGKSDEEALVYWRGIKKDIRRGCAYFWRSRPGKKPPTKFQR